MSKSLLILLLASLVVSQITLAQKNLQPGAVITSRGDTLKGFIDYRNWEKNPIAIDFYQTRDTNPVTYSPQQLRNFKVSGETYFSAVVTIDDSPYRTEEIKEGVKFNYITDTVFLLSLVDGEKSLFYYMDLKGKQHFFIPGNSGFDLLLHKNYLRKDPKTGVLKEAQNLTFVGQLNLYLKDCSSIQSKLAAVKYNRKSLLELYQYYYLTTKGKPALQNTAISRQYKFGALLGLSFAQLKYTNGMDYLTKTDFPVSRNITAGISYNVIFPRNFGRLSLNNELIYYRFNTNGYYNVGNASVTTRIGFNYVVLNAMLQRKFPLGKVDLLSKGGITLGYGFNETNFQKFDETLSQRASEGKAFEKMEKLMGGINLGFGIKYNHYSIEGRYLLGVKKFDFTNSNTSVPSKTNTAFVLLGYEF